MAAETRCVAVATGASSGIGLATAIALASEGWRVIGLGRDAARSDAAEAALRTESSGGRQRTPHPCVDDAASVERLSVESEKIVCQAGI